MTLERLASATGLTKSYLSKIQNSRKLPPIATLSRIAQALGTGIGSFFGDILEAREGASAIFLVQDRDARLILFIKSNCSCLGRILIISLTNKRNWRADFQHSSS